MTVKPAEAATQLVRFGVVGLSGVVVNLLAVVVCTKLGGHPDTIALPLPVTRFNIRAYHLYATFAFLVANLWNFQLNRWWTFETAARTRWLGEYARFLVAGLTTLAMNLVVLTLLLHHGSPVGLSTHLLDDSSVLRNRFYWAQVVAVGLVTPVSFVVNKAWTFRVAERDQRSGSPLGPAPVAIRPTPPTTITVTPPVTTTRTVR